MGEKNNTYMTRSNQTKHSSYLDEILDELCVRFILNCPEEEYESFERLFFQIEEAHWFYEDFYRENAKQSGMKLPPLSLKEFAEAIFEHCPHLSHFRPNVQSQIKSFWEYKSRVPVYGAIILNKSLDKVLLVQGYFSKTWSFPRGKINKDESEVDCAIREVKEEIGLDLTGQINEDKFILRTVREQPVKLFVVTGVSEDVKLVTYTRKEISAFEWHKIDQIIGSSSSPRGKSSKKYWLVSPFVREISNWLKQSKTTYSSSSAVQYVDFHNNTNYHGNNKGRRTSPTTTRTPNKKSHNHFISYSPSTTSNKFGQEKPQTPVSSSYSPPKFTSKPFTSHKQAPLNNGAGIQHAPPMRSGESLFNFSFNTEDILDSSPRVLA